MLAIGRPLSAVVYRAGHHGANNSSSAAFLEAVRPQHVVISAGEGNDFGHPHEEMLQPAMDVGAAVLRTDELGTIEEITDGNAMWWEAQNEQQFHRRPSLIGSGVAMMGEDDRLFLVAH